MTLSFEDFILTINGSTSQYTIEARGPNGMSTPPEPFVLELDEEAQFILNTIEMGRRPSVEQLRKVGILLFNALFSGRVRDAYMKARTGDNRLCLKLNVRPPDLALLPWELLYDEGESAFLARRRNRPVVRMLDSTVHTTAQASGSWRILHVQASPIDQPPLNLEASRSALAKSIGKQADITLLTNATPTRLRETLSQEKYDILHYDGHAAFDKISQRGLLFLHGVKNRTNPLPSDKLADYLAGTTIQLVVLTACQTGVNGTKKNDYRFTGLAQHLMHSNSLSALIAMQFAVKDQAAIAFNRAFYKALAAGLPVEVAVADGRLAMREVTHDADWLAPILFMRRNVQFPLQVDRSAQAAQADGVQWSSQPPSRRTPNPFYGPSKQFIGREDELWRILGKLRAGNHCSIVGSPGSGKTSLLREALLRLVQELGWQEEEALLIGFRTIVSLTDVKERIVTYLGGQKTNQIRKLMRRRPLRVLALDDLGGMDAGKRGYKIRRWLRGFAEQHQIRLLIVSNERLDILFRHDDPTRDSPFETLDRLPVQLDPLSQQECLQLVQQRLAGSTLGLEQFGDLLNTPHQPKDLLDACAQRYEELRRGIR